MEMRRPQRAVAQRRAPLRLPLRGHLLPAHDRQGEEPRHRLVLDHGPRMAGDPRRHGAMARRPPPPFRPPPATTPPPPHPPVPTGGGAVWGGMVAWAPQETVGVPFLASRA